MERKRYLNPMPLCIMGCHATGLTHSRSVKIYCDGIRIQKCSGKPVRVCRAKGEMRELPLCADLATSAEVVETEWIEIDPSSADAPAWVRERFGRS